ncbi:MAG: hypothetical protein FJ125_01080 [Deltaproteobacteria bacterium]|nr:hypothetical protein [Deltaproteobacteria bacterium]
MGTSMEHPEQGGMDQLQESNVRLRVELLPEQQERIRQAAGVSMALLDVPDPARSSRRSGGIFVGKTPGSSDGEVSGSGRSGLGGFF